MVQKKHLLDITEKPGTRRPTNAERSAYFARREAARVLRIVLQGDARRRAVASIKSLVYSPSVRNKKATFALVCQTLKHFRIIKDVLDTSRVISSKWKKQEELIYIIAYDILFGQENLLSGGDAEKFLFKHKDALQSALARILVKNKVNKIEHLIARYQPPDISRPCYVRVNTLKLDVDSALHALGKQFTVSKDSVVPGLLILPPNTDLHNHPMVLSGSVFIQGKGSSMVAAALDPKPGWEVLDACSAPGNKTVHLAALMSGKGKIIACELNKERIKRLEGTIGLSGASRNCCTLSSVLDIEVLHGDFLNLDPKESSFSNVRGILLDPSCSGSGTAAQRLDHLLPSHEADDMHERLNKLAAFQKKALAHALSFPMVERVVYSTCSVNQIENEDVVESILPLASSLGFELASPFPNWHRRGLPVFEGSEHLLRTDPVEDKEGFFIALFVRKNSAEASKRNQSSRQPSLKKENGIRRFNRKKKRILIPPFSRGLFGMWFNYRYTK